MKIYMAREENIDVHCQKCVWWGNWSFTRKTLLHFCSFLLPFQLLAITGSIFLLLYIMLCYENFHFHVAHMYAHLGYPNAQHIVGQRYLKGNYLTLAVITVHLWPELRM